MKCTSSIGSHRSTVPWLLIVAATVVGSLIPAGCATSGDTALTREILTSEEIASTAALNAYEAIQMRRPAFLARAQRRALREADQPDARPVVYVNGVYFGDVESLRDIPVRQIKEIRFMEANDATRTLGTTNVGGVIFVLTQMN